MNDMPELIATIARRMRLVPDSCRPWPVPYLAAPFGNWRDNAREWGIYAVASRLAMFGPDELVFRDAPFALTMPADGTIAAVWTNHGWLAGVPFPGWLWRDLRDATDGAAVAWAVNGGDRRLIAALVAEGIAPPGVG